MIAGQPFADLQALAGHLRAGLRKRQEASQPKAGNEGGKRKKVDVILAYAYNRTGKTRLSMAFKDLGRKGDTRDTLYFNAFTEDLFTWDNDLDTDSDRKLKLNTDSRFFAGLDGQDMENGIRPLLQRYVDFEFRIDTTNWEVRFSRGEGEQVEDNIKISRGEERLFVWCFFLAILQQVLDGAEAYKWVEYVYIDDPVSSLDDNNAIALGNHLSGMLHGANRAVPVVLSTHHALFFDVMFNELKSGRKQWDMEGVPTKRLKFLAYFLMPQQASAGWELVDQTGDLPFFHHVALLTELKRAAEAGELYTYHFNMLRNVLEKTAVFHGYKNFSACLLKDDNDPDGTLHARYLNILSHGNYSLYEPNQMGEDTKAAFCKILKGFLARFPFNAEVLTPPPQAGADPEVRAGEAA